MLIHNLIHYLYYCIPFEKLLPLESTHMPNLAAGTEWVVHSDGAMLEVDLDVHPLPLPQAPPEAISTPQSSSSVPMLAFAYISGKQSCM